jgi:hypothetical protein
MRAAFGFRAHSGWAAFVAVGGTFEAPHVLERRRIVIADPEMSGSKQPYHAAVGLALPEADRFVKRAIDSSRALAVEAITAARKTLQARGHEIAACGVVVGSGKPLPHLEKILAAHPLLHTAEGEMFRDVLLWAVRECALRVTAVPQRDLDPAVLKRIDSLGKLIGPPWTQDQKFATVAALMALHTTEVLGRTSAHR